VRIVLDTNVLVRAFVSARGPAAEVLRRVATGHRLLLSPYLLDEVERVLAYPRLRKTARFEPGDVERFLNLLIEAGELVFPMVDTPAPVSDPNDIAILHTAAGGKAEVICTLDRHLFQPEVIAWCHDFGIRVERDIELLQRL
jgi:putative PIN family toxin of toxin-antitoxin system